MSGWSPQLTDVFALFGISVVLCAGLLALLASWCGAATRTAVVRLTAVCFIVLLWIPVGTAHIPAVAYVRGISADLSITLIALAVWRICCAAFNFPPPPKREKVVVLVAVALAALFLYPLALGWGDWDPYSPGWGSWGMLLALLLICAGCLANGLKVLPASVALALMAWSLSLMESSNLWDYLFDPWLSVFAIGYVVKQVLIKYAPFPAGRFIKRIFH